MRQLLKRVLPRRLADVLRLIRYPDFELVAGPLTYNQDWLATAQKSTGFLYEEPFATAYRVGQQTGSWGTTEPRWRGYINCWAANHVKHLPGDFVECGVNRGGSALMVMRYLNFTTLAKRFYLLDTFSGFVDEYLMAEEKKLGRVARATEDCFAVVQETFRDFPNVCLIRGAVPDTLPQVDTNEICYLHLDMNSAIPELATAEFFWDRLVRGAVILSDDYGWTLHVAQKQALDEFAARRNVQILALPTGQGLIFKS